MGLLAQRCQGYVENAPGFCFLSRIDKITVVFFNQIYLHIHQYMMFSAMLTDAFQDGDNGIPIMYHFDGKLFNLRTLQAKSKVQTEVLDEFLFADDMAKGAPTEEKIQKKKKKKKKRCGSSI